MSDEYQDISERIDSIEKRKETVVYFALLSEFDTEEGIFAWITDKETWDERGCVNDCIRKPRDLRGWSDDMEGLMSRVKPCSMEEARQELLDNGFSENPDFTAFILEHPI